MGSPIAKDKAYAGVGAHAAGKKKKTSTRRSRSEKEKDRDKDKDRKTHKDRSEKKDKKREKVEIPSSEDTNIRVGSYQMLEAIGKGGFGTVYRGLNVKTGATVAVKRVGLHGIPKEELEGIEMEINLLKNLSHPNIVKYIDAIRSDEYLNIVLEFVENGALSALLGKLNRHGNVEEQLVAVYTLQILEGLKYLHQQGVIHRDIKGANILATKDGIVKLADFGVATKLSESRKSDSVVGTPYWMAPEIIEMTGQQSSACDIWSVGCTVVELFTGKPPYFDLQQMPALFRIVQDEHPPLPDGISSMLEDFLMQCFQKDPLRRISAADLLKHSWLRAAQQNRKEDLLLADKRYRDIIGADSLDSIEEKAHDAGHKKALSASSEDFSDFDDEEEEPAPKPKIKLPESKQKSGVQAPPPSSVSVGDSSLDLPPVSLDQSHPIEAWQEENDEIELGDDLDLGNDEEFDTSKLQTSTRKNWDEAGAEQNKEDDVEDVFADVEFESDPRTDQDAKIHKGFLRVINSLSPKEEESVIIANCNKLTEMLSDPESQEYARNLMTSHAVIPIMEMLEVPNPNVIVAVLKVVNEVIGVDQKFQQSMSLVGLIPAIVKFASPGFPTSIRLEAANFVRHFCYASDFTRKMFIACGGLPVLVGFMEELYETNKTLVFNAIDCIRHVFDVSAIKNDFCRLFCKYGLLGPLAKSLLNVNNDKEHPDAPAYVLKIANIVYLFSQGDAVVKTHMAKPAIIEDIFKTLPTLPHEALNLLLKSIRCISMDPNTLDLLEAAGAIPALITFLDSQYPDVQNQVLLCMYYLSTIKASRQEQAARSGIIPHLQRFIRANHPLKQFALPIIFQLAKTSKRTRMELKKHSGVLFFLDLLEESYWKTHAIDALAVWLQDDPQRVEYILDSNLYKLVAALKGTRKGLQFEKMLGPLEKILSISTVVNRALGRNTTFVDEVISRLDIHSDSNAIRVALLKILTSLYEGHDNGKEFASKHNLVPVLEKLAADTSAVLVSQVAKNLLDEINGVPEGTPAPSP